MYAYTVHTCMHTYIHTYIIIHTESCMRNHIWIIRLTYLHICIAAWQTGRTSRQASRQAGRHTYISETHFTENYDWLLSASSGYPVIASYARHFTDWFWCWIWDCWLELSLLLAAARTRLSMAVLNAVLTPMAVTCLWLAITWCFRCEALELLEHRNRRKAHVSRLGMESVATNENSEVFVRPWSKWLKLFA